MTSISELVNVPNMRSSQQFRGDGTHAHSNRICVNNIAIPFPYPRGNGNGSDDIDQSSEDCFRIVPWRRLLSYPPRVSCYEEGDSPAFQFLNKWSIRSENDLTVDLSLLQRIYSLYE